MRMRALWVLGLLLLAAPAAADTARFQVRLAGLPVGEMVVAENSDGHVYAARSVFQTTGLAGLLAKVRFEMSARGAGALPNVSARHYSEDLDTGYRASAVAIDFASGDRRIDPLTAILAALADRGPQVGCQFDRKTWDGVRSMHVEIAGTAGAGGFTCSGMLTRVAGYSAEDMSEARSFPFSVRFEPQGGMMVAVRADVRTIHGPVALVRR